MPEGLPATPSNATARNPSGIRALQLSKSNSIRSRGRRSSTSGPIGVEKLPARFVHPFISMRAKVVALSLQEVRGQPVAAIAVEVIQCAAETWRGDAELGGLHDHATPRRLALADSAAEKLVEEEVHEVRITSERL